MEQEMKLREWIERFNNCEFDNKDVFTQIKAGWYDWFCRDTSLQAKTKRMGTIIKRIKDGGKINLDTSYVWFKNNCPLVGKLYDDFRIADIETGEVILTVTLNGAHYDKRYTVWGKRNDFKERLFETDSSRNLVKWLNEEWNDYVC